MGKHNQDDIAMGIQAYFDEINRFQLLDFDQELNYSRLIEQGNEDALNALINSNLRLVVKIAKAYTRPDMSLMDIIQEGNLGLIKAAKKYDYRKQVRFCTYASWWIKQSIKRALTDKRRTIRLPHRKEEALKRLQRIAHDFSNEFYRHPTTEELSDYTGISVEEVKATLELDNAIISLYSNTTVENGNLIDLLEDKSYTPDEDLMRKHLEEDTHRFLDTLREKEKAIIKLRFALDGGEKKTLRSIADSMGLSPETVRQMEIKAMKKLRYEAQSMRDYMLN